MLIFDFLRETGKLDPREMFNVFNMGIGMILIAAPTEAEGIVRFLNERDAQARVIGRVAAGSGVTVR